MKVATSTTEFRNLRRKLPAPVGFVPTMGSLHDGHLSLVRIARERCAAVVASIYVNPSQFAPTEDLADYPRDLDRDLGRLDEAGVDLVFAPSERPGLYGERHDTWIDLPGMTSRLEGAARPTHFRGVATIVAKLFHIVEADVAVFGQKDAQQALVIKRMIDDLDFDIELVLGPTIREPDGLAMSSRNTYLSPEERRAAAALYRSLQLAEKLYADGERDAETLRTAMMETLEAETLLQPEYVSVAAPQDLTELVSVDRKALVSLAVRAGKTRLIDNAVLPPGEDLL
ncbi:pantoate--beta-alanine ligase [Candidatus Bipolaricaulota bacterium]|nr:pantoate--beta-alanine ligase [Candidatus Bipolaricaulota bacterium]